MAPQLVALSTAHPRFVDELRRVWDLGNAVLPADHRLPEAARSTLFSALKPSSFIDADGDEASLDGQPVEPGDALVVATSGSTGVPKGVVLTHAAVKASAKATSTAMHVTDDDHWLACLPLAHIGGLSVVTRALYQGTPLTLTAGFSPEVVERGASIKATLVSLVPTALRRCDTSAYRTVLLGGSAIPTDRPANTIATYGMTETGSGVVYDGYPIPTAEVRIVDGEVQVRGPMLLRTYRDGADPKDARGWLATQDLGELATDGQLTVHGRKGDLIITGGENVWPEPVERRLLQHPDIRDVVVVGRPDAEWGQVVTAVIETDAPPALDEIRDLVKEHLPAHHAPKAIELVDRIPRTPSGKPQRHLL